MPALTTVTRTLVRALAIPALAASMVLAQAAARPPVPIARAQPPTGSAQGGVIHGRQRAAPKMKQRGDAQ